MSDEEFEKVRIFSKFHDKNGEDDSNVYFKIANSKWDRHRFDISELQKAPLNIKGRGNFKIDNLKNEYSICSNFKYLPYPYSKTTLVSFVPKFKVFNQ